MKSLALQKRSQGPATRIPAELHAVEQVVKVGFPLTYARSYLRRHMSNPIGVKLVEAHRGERLGHVREAEIIPASGAAPIFIRAVRLRSDGQPATPFPPDDRLPAQARLYGAGAPSQIQPGPQDRIILHVPVRGYMRYLPGIYQGAMFPSSEDPPPGTEVSQRDWALPDGSAPPQPMGTDPLGRFLFIFQHVMSTVLEKVEDIPSLTDPSTADPRFLPWIASWVNFHLDASLPTHQQRELVRRAIRLYRSRGTKQGVEEMVRVLTSVPARIEEREKPPPMVLGGAHLPGGATVWERFQRGEPSAAFLAPRERPATRYFALELETRERFKARFGERTTEVLRRICQVVTTEKPAQVSFTIRFRESGHLDSR